MSNMSTQDEFRHQIGAYTEAVFMHSIALRHGKTHQEAADAIMDLVLAREQSIKEEARRTARQENVRDFSAVVKAFNEALTADFDRPSVRTLRTVLNSADARANYVDLPEQVALHSTNNSLEEKE